MITIKKQLTKWCIYYFIVPSNNNYYISNFQLSDNTIVVMYLRENFIENINTISIFNKENKNLMTHFNKNYTYVNQLDYSIGKILTKQLLNKEVLLTSSGLAYEIVV